MNHDNLIASTKAFVQTELKNAEGGHDWFHILRVYNNAKLISKNENVDNLVVELAALLHDIADPKFNNGDESIGPRKASEFLLSKNVDRLDAIGAIGIARCFNYGGFKNRALYNPDIAPNLNMTKAEYKASEAPTINHFYEKLLLLKDQMNTKTGKCIALNRHKFMEDYLKQFYAEWEGDK